MTKIPRFLNFFRFYAIFVKFSADFVDWNVEKSQEGTSLLSSSLLGRGNCGFRDKKISQIGTEIHKKPKNFKLSMFYAVFVIFMTDFVDWNVEKGQQ